jgi:hypothetical protein
MVPRTDAALVAYASNWNTRLQQAPGDYGVTPEQAQRFAGLFATYLAIYNAMMSARAEGTWSRSQTQSRDAARSALLAYARELYAMVQANSSVPAANKTLLGIHVRATGVSRAGAPTERPAVGVGQVNGRTIEVEIYDPVSMRKRGKPKDAAQAIVFFCVGDSYASDANEWRFAGLSTRHAFAFSVPDTVPAGARVWVRAAWTSRTGDAGPTSLPVSTNVQGGGVDLSRLRRAA